MQELSRPMRLHIQGRIDTIIDHRKTLAYSWSDLLDVLKIYTPCFHSQQVPFVYSPGIAWMARYVLSISYITNKSALHLCKRMFQVRLSRCRTDFRKIFGNAQYKTVVQLQVASLFQIRSFKTNIIYYYILYKTERKITKFDQL